MRTRQWAPIATLGLWAVGCGIASGITGRVPASWPNAIIALVITCLIVALVAKRRLASGRDQGI